VIQVNTHEAKTKLSELLRRIEQTGEKVRICRHGHPIALLVPVGAPGNPLKQHAKLRGIQFNEDPCAPLSPQDWPDEAK
jgi:prevent-host-death family protein